MQEIWAFQARVLKYNLLSISQLCDSEHRISFNKERQTSKMIFCVQNIVSTSRPLESLHIDLFRPTKTAFIGGKHYRLVVQNSVVERKNWSLQEMVRMMSNDNSIPKHFYTETVNTTCYLHNKIYIRPILKKTSNELWKGKNPNISYFHVFGCEFFILNIKDHLGKFDSKLDRRTFLGYYETSKAYKDKVHVRSTIKSQEQVALISKIEPKNIGEALFDDGYVEAKKELDQFHKN
ncbi:hypothetical protein CR513_08414, partial [Mucuna pruriens]